MSPAEVRIDPIVKKIVEGHGRDEGDLIAILQDLQAQFRYLPKEKLKDVARELGIPENRVYSVATFFRAFSLTPKGKHDVHVCTGTACHVRGAPRLVDELKRIIGADVRGTSKDGNFSLDIVNCVGSCALGPVITVDEELFGKVTLKDLRKIIKNFDASPTLKAAAPAPEKPKAVAKPKAKPAKAKPAAKAKPSVKAKVQAKLKAAKKPVAKKAPAKKAAPKTTKAAKPAKKTTKPAKGLKKAAVTTAKKIKGSAKNEAKKRSGSGKAKRAGAKAKRSK